jgi:hypothetical protein
MYLLYNVNQHAEMVHCPLSRNPIIVQNLESVCLYA